MVLRASAESNDTNLELRGITESGATLGSADGDLLVTFVNALLSSSEPALNAARSDLAELLGHEGVVGASVIAGNFSRNDRIANAIGIPLEGDFVSQSADFRETLGINQFRSARASLGT